MYVSSSLLSYCAVGLDSIVFLQHEGLFFFITKHFLDYA